ncbi:hypothetical protein SAY86_003732 [Trapa natans]|uniref:BHLH domain-containing protein n=1 Tax=Trapa natans TaxID=22666 RepID=A0AAN7RI71_TRANT|nr:hypothetical protein SAY86_003732 [Trapa natans]
MALEAIVFPQDPLIYCPHRPDIGGYNPFGLQSEEQEGPRGYGSIYGCCNDNDWTGGNYWDLQHTSSPEAVAVGGSDEQQSPAAAGGRRKRRRVKSAKNLQEIENQRMTHIAVERNRRKLMNEYLAVLRSLMPQSYSQRGDQASIIGGAINFVKELEHLLQSMESTHKIACDGRHNSDPISPRRPFSDFFTFPQYSTTRAVVAGEEAAAATDAAAAADVEVSMMESHASIKIQSRRRPKQLLRLVAGLQVLRLGVLHLNVTSSGDMVMYSVSVKVEEGCHLTTVDEIAAAVNEMFRRIEAEEVLS